MTIDCSNQTEATICIPNCSYVPQHNNARVPVPLLVRAPSYFYVKQQTENIQRTNQTNKQDFKEDAFQRVLE
jgi:hypothetical protein